jgi:single-strand DNA-binding protein
MYQKTIVIGHLGRDPEMRYTPSGLAVTSFSVASTRKWTDKNGQQQEKTTWFRITAWDKLGELCNQYLTKGKLVFVEGDIDANAYTSQDGQPRASLELTARNIRFLSGGGQGGEAEGALRERGPVMEDDIPF